MRRIALAGLVVLLGLPQAASAQVAIPHIDSVSPATIVRGSPDTTIAITGTGFSASDSGGARLGDGVWVSGLLVPSTVVDDRHMTAIVPSSQLSSERLLDVTIYAGAYALGFGVPAFGSNTVQITVVAPPPNSLTLSTFQQANVGSCTYVGIQALDAQGKRTSSVGVTISLSSDDVETTAAGDGDLTLSTGSCGSTPVTSITGNSPIGSFPTLLVLAARPVTAIVTATVTGSGVTGSSAAIRFAGGTIGGRVTTSHGAPAAGIEVFATGGYPPPAARGFSTSSCVFPTVGHPQPELVFGDLTLRHVAVTAADGTYVSDPLPPGDVRLLFRSPSASGLASTWSGGVTDPAHAAGLTVVDREQTAQDAVLEDGGGFAGHITASDGHLDLADVHVLVLDHATGHTLDVVSTSPDGTFATGGLTPGAYDVGFQPGSGYRATRTGPVDVSTGATTGGVNAVLHPGAVLTGGLVAEDSGKPISGWVTVYDATGTARAVGYADATTNGAFRTSPGLPPGDYALRLGPVDAAYPGGWYHGDAFASAERVHLGADQIEHRDLATSRGAAFTGTLMNDAPLVTGVDAVRAPAPALFGIVSVYRADNHQLSGCAFSGQDGAFVTSGLAPGRYIVRFDTHLGPSVAPTYYPDASDISKADVLALSSGQTRGLGTVDLHRGATISGRITDVASAPVAGLLVSAVHDPSDPPLAYFFSSTPVAVTDGSGAYSIRALMAGRYRITARVYTKGPYASYQTLYFPAAAVPSAATTIRVRPQQTLGGIDISVPAPALVSGTVGGSAGPHAFTSVSMVDPLTGASLMSTYPASDGTYTVQLVPGTYDVRFSGSSRAQVWYGGSATRTTSASLMVAGGTTTTGIGATLPPGRLITGHVAGPSGVPAPSRVTVFDTDGDIAATAFAGQDGSYTTTPLEPGTYNVRIVPSNDVLSDATIADVHVSPDADTTGVDASLSYA